MVFSSMIFLWLFLPIVLILYFICKEKYRNYILLIASLIFYAWGEPKFVFVMLASIVCNWTLAILIDKSNENKRKQVYLSVAVFFNIGLLFVFKYLNFFVAQINKIESINIIIRDIALPIGISFFTFQALSYVIDVYWGRVEVQKNFFLLFFHRPQKCELYYKMHLLNNYS